MSGSGRKKIVGERKGSSDPRTFLSCLARRKKRKKRKKRLKRMKRKNIGMGGRRTWQEEGKKRKNVKEALHGWVEEWEWTEKRLDDAESHQFRCESSFEYGFLAPSHAAW